MVIHVPQAVREFHLREVAAGITVSNGLEALRAPNPAGQPRREQVLTIVLRSHRNRSCEIALKNLPEVLPVIEGLALEHRVKRHRKPRRGPQDPGKPPMNIIAAPAQRAMLKLQFDGLVVSNFTTYIQNVPVADF